MLIKREPKKKIRVNRTQDEPFRQKDRILTGLWKAGSSSEGAKSRIGLNLSGLWTGNGGFRYRSPVFYFVLLVLKVWNLRFILQAVCCTFYGDCT